MVGVGLFVLTVGVVQDEAVAGAGGEVQAAAFSLAGMQATTGIEVGAGLGVRRTMARWIFWPSGVM